MVCATPASYDIHHPVHPVILESSSPRPRSLALPPPDVGYDDSAALGQETGINGTQHAGYVGSFRYYFYLIHILYSKLLSNKIIYLSLFFSISIIFNYLYFFQSFFIIFNHSILFSIFLYYFLSILLS